MLDQFESDDRFYFNQEALKQYNIDKKVSFSNTPDTLLLVIGRSGVGPTVEEQVKELLDKPKSENYTLLVIESAEEFSWSSSNSKVIIDQFNDIRVYSLRSFYLEDILYLHWEFAKSNKSITSIQGEKLKSEYGTGEDAGIPIVYEFIEIMLIYPERISERVMDKKNMGLLYHEVFLQWLCGDMDTEKAKILPDDLLNAISFLSKKTESNLVIGRLKHAIENNLGDLTRNQQLLEKLQSCLD